MTVMHKHHIVPRYRCEELGIDPDFEENIVEVTREQHALIHWGYQCGDLEPLLEVCDPSPEILEMIALGDNRDSGAAVLLAQGEIDGIDNRGKNHPNYKHGLCGTPEYNREYYEKNKERIKEQSKKWYEENKESALKFRKKYAKQYREKNKEKIKESRKKYNYNRKEYQAEYQAEYRADPKNKEKAKEYQREYQRQYRDDPKNKEKLRKLQSEWRKKNKEKRRESAKRYYAKKKAEKLAQQTGATLPL